MSDVLDDLDARPGSAASLLRTLVGAAFRAEGGWLPVASIIELMATVGVAGPRTRTALSRAKDRGLLVARAERDRPGYAIAASALPMLARGDRRIYHPRFMRDEGDRWCLVSFSIPEEDRDLRHQLRRRLSWIGCGIVSPALWICPAFLADEVEGIVAAVGVADRVAIFLADEVRGAGDLRTAVERWWDLGALRKLHEGFLREHAAAIAAFHADPEPRVAFRTWIHALDAWHPIPYLDPGLPPSMLPADWPGLQSIPLFLELRDAVHEPARRHVHTVLTGVGYPDAARVSE